MTFLGGVYILHPNFRGFRASSPSAGILRYPPPPLDVFDTFPVYYHYSIDEIRTSYFTENLHLKENHNSNGPNLD